MVWAVRGGQRSGVVLQFCAGICWWSAVGPPSLPSLPSPPNLIRLQDSPKPPVSPAEQAWGSEGIALGTAGPGRASWERAWAIGDSRSGKNRRNRQSQLKPRDRNGRSGRDALSPALLTLGAHDPLPSPDCRSSGRLGRSTWQVERASGAWAGRLSCGLLTSSGCADRPWCRARVGVGGGRRRDQSRAADPGPESGHSPDSADPHWREPSGSRCRAHFTPPEAGGGYPAEPGDAPPCPPPSTNADTGWQQADGCAGRLPSDRPTSDSPDTLAGGIAKNCRAGFGLGPGSPGSSRRSSGGDSDRDWRGDSERPLGGSCRTRCDADPNAK